MQIGFAFAILVGMTLGLVGSGGTILTVPILVYIMGVDPVLATTYSLFAVGTTAFIGGLRGLRKGEVDLAHVCHFGIPSLLSVFLTRTFLLPLVPEVIYIGSFSIHQAVVLMLLFAVVMLASAISMIRSATSLSILPSVPSSSNRMTVGIAGMLVGFVTGVVGAGGGFLIIPVLVNFFHLSIRRAVATSLLIIAINSFFGLMGDLEKFRDFDWYLLLGYTLFTIGGIFAGFSLSKKISSSLLKKIFGYFILAVALAILITEVSGNHNI